MSTLREAQRRQEYRAEIMRGYQAALCNSDIPGWTLGDEVAKVADNLLAAHPAEPAPVTSKALYALLEDLDYGNLPGSKIRWQGNEIWLHTTGQVEGWIRSAIEAVESGEPS